MKKLNAFLFRFAGAVPEYLFACDAAEQQRYRTIAYLVLVIGVFTSWSVHHAALLCGLADPAASVVALAWGGLTVICNQAVIQALVPREGQAVSGMAIRIRMVFIVITALILTVSGVLALNQNSNARVRMDMKKEALASDQAYFVGHYALSDHEKAVSGTETAMKALDTKLNMVPPRILDLRDKVSACSRDLDALVRENVDRRTSLKEQIATYKTQLAAPTGSGTPADRTDTEISIEQSRNDLARLERVESQKKGACQSLSERAAGAANEHFGPLKIERASQAQALNKQKQQLREANEKFDAAMQEAEQASSQAFGFNLAGETSAIVKVLARSWLSALFALVILAGSMSVELMPIVLKMRARGGPYDQRVDAEEKIYKARTEALLEQRRKEVANGLATELAASDLASRQKQELLPMVIAAAREVTAHSMLNEEIARAQEMNVKRAGIAGFDTIGQELAFTFATANTRNALTRLLDAGKTESNVAPLFKRGPHGVH